MTEPRIREESEADHDAIREVHRSAFSGPAESQLVDELRRIGAAVISLVAERDRRIMGHVLFSKIEAPMRALALAPVGIDPEVQNSGMGSALIREGLRRADDGGWDAVFVLGNPAYYTHFGFSIEAAKEYSCPYSGEHFMIRTLSGRVTQRDSGLIYPAPFAALD